MHILSIPTKVHWDWHVACELDILDQELDKGNTVTVIVPHWYDSQIDTTPSWSESMELDAHLYNQKNKHSYSLLNKEIEVIYMAPVDFPPSFEKWLNDLPEDIESLSDLRSACYEGFDVGAAAVSSFVSEYRKVDVDLKDEWALLRNYLKCSYAHFLAVDKYIKELRIDVVLIFNGRFAASRGVLRASRANSKEVWIHERGSDKKKYEIFKNHLPHDRGNFKTRLGDWKRDVSVPEIQEAAQIFYEGRCKGVSQGWYSYTGEQIENKLPAEWDDTLHNVVVYNSSEDEFFSIGDDWINPIYGSQLGGLEKILEDLREIKGIHLWLRMHPNLQNVSEQELERWFALEQEWPNISIVAPDSEVSSYSLLNAADKVLTFGSTMSIEATYWGKTSIIAGVSFYSGLGSVYEPCNHEEVVNLIKDEKLDPLPKDGAIEFGAFLVSFGKGFVYNEVIGFNGVLYKGIRLPSMSDFLLKYLEKNEWTGPEAVDVDAFTDIKLCPMEKLVTVGIPNYNGGKYIEETIHSVYGQTYKKFKLVVIDDGSTDDSVKKLRALQSTYGFHLEVQENKGVSKTLNRIVHEFAEGDYFAYTCADDILDPKRLEKQVSFMESKQSEGCIMCHADMTVIDETGKFGDPWVCRNPHASDLFMSFYRDDTGISSPTTMFRLPEFRELGGYDDRFLMEDYPTWLKLAKVTKFGYIPESLVYYRRHDSNLSGNEFRNCKFVDEVMGKYVDSDPTCVDILHEKRFCLTNHFIETNNEEAASYFLKLCKKSRFRSLDSMERYFELCTKLNENK